ncbi:SGNH/GDSL hydrolase family protein [Arthrobacter monumenti]
MQSLYAYGHSWIDGDGAGEPSRCLVDMVAAQLGATAENRGVGGSLSTATADLVTAEPPGYADIFVLMTGLNDARLYGPSTTAVRQYADALAVIFEAFRNANGSAFVVAVEQPYLLDYSGHAPHNVGSSAAVDAYNARLREVSAAHTGTRLVVVDDWNPRTMLSNDAVHPNDAGHACIAAAVIRAVDGTVEIP